MCRVSEWTNESRSWVLTSLCTSAIAKVCPSQFRQTGWGWQSAGTPHLKQESPSATKQPSIMGPNKTRHLGSPVPICTRIDTPSHSAHPHRYFLLQLQPHRSKLIRPVPGWGGEESLTNDWFCTGNLLDWVLGLNVWFHGFSGSLNCKFKIIRKHFI